MRGTKPKDVRGQAADDTTGSNPVFETIKQKRAFQEVVDQIRREVSLGRLKPGDKLPPERELAEQMRVSRAAIREGMRALENAGLIRCYQGMGGGAFIQEQDSSTMTQALADNVMLGRVPTANVTEMRIILIDQAIRLACARASNEDFDALEADIERLEQLAMTGDLSRRHAHINDFYRILAAATHNQVMVMLVESLSELTRAILVRASPAPRKDVVGVRKKVVKLMRSGDVEGAVKEMRAHLQRLGRYLEENRNSQTAGS